jgi:hypothetical protein
MLVFVREEETSYQIMGIYNTYLITGKVRSGDANARGVNYQPHPQHQ